MTSILPTSITKEHLRPLINPIVSMGIAFLAGSTRLIEYFPASTLGGLVTTAALASAAIAISNRLTQKTSARIGGALLGLLLTAALAPSIIQVLSKRFVISISERAVWKMVALCGTLEFATSFFQSQPVTEFSKKLTYEASLAYTKFNGNSWWSKIEPYNLYLGALPLNNLWHSEGISKLGVTHVLSMVEDFEMDEGWFNVPVKGQDWEKHGIVNKQIKAVDFLPLKQEEIEEGVKYLHSHLEKGKIVYVHCKAGRGRSASIVIAYLMKYHGFSFDQAFAFVKKQRPQINLNSGQRRAVHQYSLKN